MLRKFHLVSILLAAILLAFTVLPACQSFPTSEKPVVRYVNFKVYDPVYVALDKGFFEKNGIQVEIIGDTLAGPTAIQAVASGAAEAGLSSIPAIINANAAGLPVTGVSDIQSAIDDQPLEYYYSLKGSGIESIKDMEGKRLAVNLIKSSFHYTALLALHQEGVPEETVEFVLLPFDAQLPALLNGEVDVVGLMEPYNGMALGTAGDKLQPVYDAQDVFGSKQFTLHFVNRIWAKEHPDQAKAFVSAVVEAIAWIEANQEEAKAIIAEHTKIPAEYVPEYHFQPNGQVVMDDVQFWLDYLIERGDVTATWLKAEDVATNQYNPLLEK